MVDSLEVICRLEIRESRRLFFTILFLISRQWLGRQISRIGISIYICCSSSSSSSDIVMLVLMARTFVETGTTVASVETVKRMFESSPIHYIDDIKVTSQNQFGFVLTPDSNFVYYWIGRSSSSTFASLQLPRSPSRQGTKDPVHPPLQSSLLL